MADSYWIIEWRYPASYGKPASEWQLVNSTPFNSREGAESYNQRSYYEYRISEFIRR